MRLTRTPCRIRRFRSLQAAISAGRKATGTSHPGDGFAIKETAAGNFKVAVKGLPKDNGWQRLPRMAYIARRRSAR